MGELEPILGAGGFVGLVIGVVYLLGANRADRKQAGEQIKEAEARADAAEERARKLGDRLDASEERRRAAEDQASELAREVKRLGDKIGELSSKIEHQEPVT